jgi:DNA-binding response OmpR family regulator
MELAIIEGTAVLIVEDEFAMGQLLATIFQKEGATCFISSDGKGALSQLNHHHPDLVLLDLMLPGEDGIEVCRRIRELTDIPIIIISARTRDQDIIRGLKSGADDYITKPFQPQVVTARAEAVLRRSGPLITEKSGTDYQDSFLKVKIAQRELIVNGRNTHLTPTEFKLLAFLVENLGRICTFDRITEQVWGEELGTSLESIQTYIWQLRQKIEPDPNKPTYILSMHGIGYRFSDLSKR